jgi:hypothetical protein
MSLFQNDANLFAVICDEPFNYEVPLYSSDNITELAKLIIQRFKLKDKCDSSIKQPACL